MAKAYVKLPDDLIERISKLGNKTDEICEKMLNAGGEVVLEKVKNNLWQPLYFCAIGCYNSAGNKSR